MAHILYAFGCVMPALACTDKKENRIFLIYKEIQKGAVAYMTNYLHFSSYIRMPFIWLCNRSQLNFLIYEENISFRFYLCDRLRYPMLILPHTQVQYQSDTAGAI